MQCPCHVWKDSDKRSRNSHMTKSQIRFKLHFVLGNEFPPSTLQQPSIADHCSIAMEHDIEYHGICNEYVQISYIIDVPWGYMEQLFVEQLYGAIYMTMPSNGTRSYSSIQLHIAPSHRDRGCEAQPIKNAYKKHGNAQTNQVRSMAISGSD